MPFISTTSNKTLVWKILSISYYNSKIQYIRGLCNFFYLSFVLLSMHMKFETVNTLFIGKFTINIFTLTKRSISICFSLSSKNICFAKHTGMYTFQLFILKTHKNYYVIRRNMSSPPYLRNILYTSDYQLLEKCW